jgi:hypothetical protein
MEARLRDGRDVVTIALSCMVTQEKVVEKLADEQDKRQWLRGDLLKDLQQVQYQKLHCHSKESHTMDLMCIASDTLEHHCGSNQTAAGVGALLWLRN